MKIIKRILLGLLALVALLLVIGLFLPSTWHVERTVTVAAPPEAIAPLIVEPRQWAQWAAWNNEMDPTMVTEYAGPPSGVGASMRWHGESMGQGTMVITKVEPGRVEYDMSLEEQGTPAHGQFLLEPAGGATKVTWIDEGDVGWFVPGRYLIPVLESMLGDHFQIGLDKLRPLAEARASA
ncbi:MAG: SRPBCC family protein [Nannocystaceae bacterium]